MLTFGKVSLLVDGVESDGDLNSVGVLSAFQRPLFGHILTTFRHDSVCSMFIDVFASLFLCFRAFVFVWQE